MTSLMPNYKDVLDKLRDDIAERTNLVTKFSIDNQKNNSDTPTLLLTLKGTVDLAVNPSKMIKSHTVLLELSLHSRAASVSNIAEIIKAESKASFIFPMAINDYNAAKSDSYEISEVEDYNVSYHSVWNNPTNSMQEVEFDRKWDLYLNITRR